MLHCSGVLLVTYMFIAQLFQEFFGVHSEYWYYQLLTLWLYLTLELKFSCI